MRSVFLADDPAGGWRAGDVVDDLGDESPNGETDVRLLRLRRTGELLSISDPYGRGLIEVYEEDPAVGAETSLRPRPGEPPAETVERVVRAVSAPLTARNSVPDRPGWTYGLAVREAESGILTVTVHGPGGEELTVTGSAYWLDNTIVDGEAGIHSRARAAIDARGGDSDV